MIYCIASLIFLKTLEWKLFIKFKLAFCDCKEKHNLLSFKNFETDDLK